MPKKKKSFFVCSTLFAIGAVCLHNTDAAGKKVYISLGMLKSICTTVHATL